MNDPAPSRTNFEPNGVEEIFHAQLLDHFWAEIRYKVN